MKIISAWLKRLIMFGGIFVVLLLVMDLNNRMVHMIQLRGELEAEQERLAELQAIKTDLDRKIDEANSEDAVAAWARQENWLQKDGDFVVVIVPDGSYEAEAEETFDKPAEEYENWDAWKLWLTFKE